MSKKTPKPKDDQTYEVREIVLAKIRGYPAWPAMVVDPEKVSHDVVKERPAGKKQNFYCVRFFPAGDHSWVMAKDISKLKTHEIEAYIAEPHKKSGDLLTGYRIALEPEKWEQELEEKRLDAEEAQADAEVDELEGEEEADDEEKPAKTKKRKRDSEVAAKSKPKAKKDKDSTEPSSRKKKVTAEKVTKGRKNGAKSKNMVESEDEGDRADGDDAGPSKKSSPPPTKKAKRDKDGDEADPEMDNDPQAQKVKDWRHKLQRGFLGKAPPKNEDMPQYDSIFTTVEEFDMKIEYLQFSKIGKVMRHIAQVDADKIPRDAEFKFKDRAQALVNKWHLTISSNKVNGTNGTVEPSSKPAAKDDATSMDIDKADIPVADAPADATEGTTATDVEIKENGNGDLTVGAAEATPIDKAVTGDVTMAEA